MNYKKLKNILIFADFDNDFSINIYKSINDIVDNNTKIFLISRKPINFLTSKNTYFLNFDEFIYSPYRKSLDTKDSFAIALNATKYGVELDFFENMKKMVIFSGSDTLFNRRNNLKLTERFNNMLKNVNAIGFRSYFHLHEYIKFSDVPFLLIPYGYRKVIKNESKLESKIKIGIIPPENKNDLFSYLYKLNNLLKKQNLLVEYNIFVKDDNIKVIDNKLKEQKILYKIISEPYFKQYLKEVNITINFMKNYDVENDIDFFLQKHHPVFVFFNREYSDFENMNNHILIYETIEGLSKKIVTLVKNYELFYSITEDGYKKFIEKQSFNSLKNKLKTRIKQIMEDSFLECHEDTDFIVDDNQDLVIFTYFSNIENHRKSARPMRVRAMRDNLRKYKRCFVFMGDEITLKRKEKFLKNLPKTCNIKMAYEESLSAPSSIHTSFGILRHNFRKFLKKNNIKYSVFLRDMYQAFPQYEKIVGIENSYARFLTLRDEVMDMILSATKIYTPSETFKKEMVLRGLIPKKYGYMLDILPPGINKSSMLYDNKYKCGLNEKIKIVYTGGLGEFYNFKKFLEAFYICEELPLEFHLYIKKQELQKSRHIYGYDLDKKSNIFIHEGSFTEMAINMNYDLGLSLFEDDSYRKMAIPVKVFDYLSLNIPVLTGKGTESGELVKKYDVGFVIDNKIPEIVNFLIDIVQKRENLLKKQKNIKNFILENLWDKRVEKVMKDCNAL